ncbi:hypothetical protein AB0N62_44835 [Streptomyces sp. NPDC093982]|uniref:hypothetical protein n=1 Tax=Streptomyces sp. NPDC093982 TaxID=3155077 RepID=UPI00341E0AE9
MSVYTPQQISQPQTQQPYGQQHFGQPQPWGLQGQQPFGQQGLGQQQLSLLVTEVSLRCAAAAVSAVVEQLRIEPLTGLQAQSHIPPHALSQVLTECARRIAPVVQTALIQITGQDQYSQPHGQFPGLQAQGRPSLFQGQGGFGQQAQQGQVSSLNI